jgi:hypothetical protein
MNTRITMSSFAIVCCRITFSLFFCSEPLILYRGTDKIISKKVGMEFKLYDEREFLKKGREKVKIDFDSELVVVGVQV